MNVKIGSTAFYKNRECTIIRCTDQAWYCVIQFNDDGFLDTVLKSNLKSKKYKISFIKKLFQWVALKKK